MMRVSDVVTRRSCPLEQLTQSFDKVPMNRFQGGRTPPPYQGGGRGRSRRHGAVNLPWPLLGKEGNPRPRRSRTSRERAA